MLHEFLNNNFHADRHCDKRNIPNKIYHKLINPNNEVIAGLYRLGGVINLGPQGMIESRYYKSRRF